MIRLAAQEDLSRVMRNHVFGASDQFLHKPGYKALDDDKTLGISDLRSRGIVLSA